MFKVKIDIDPDTYKNGEYRNRPYNISFNNKIPYILYLKKLKKETIVADFNLLASGIIGKEASFSYLYYFRNLQTKDAKGIIYSFDENYDTDHFPSIIIDDNKTLISTTDKFNNLYILDLESKKKLFQISIENIIEFTKNNDNSIDQTFSFGDNFYNKEILNFGDKKYFYFRIKTTSGFKIAVMESDDGYNFKNFKICKINSVYQNCEIFFSFIYKDENYLIAKFIDNNSEILMTLKIISPIEFEQLDLMFNFPRSQYNLEIFGYDPYNRNQILFRAQKRILGIKTKN